MPVINVDPNRPSFYLFPVNNNRTAWRPFGLPIILYVPHKRDSLGGVIPYSEIFSVRVYIENVPQSAYVAGHDHQSVNGQIRYPDRELFAVNLSAIDLADKQIDVMNCVIYRNDQIIDYSEIEEGDLVEYVTSTGVKDKFKYLIGCDYYDLSSVLIDVEDLPSDNYNIVYEGQYYTRIISNNDKEEFLCINVNSISLALFKFGIQHPGSVIEEFYRLTPPPYLSNDRKSLDTTVSLYRPFTDVVQDVMDEQALLERVNWVFDAPAEMIPYISALLGWDLPFFPKSLDNLRRAVLRRTVEFQNLKGSRRAIKNIFKLFGFEVLISNLWWSKDGLRLIRPGEILPGSYASQQIDIVDQYQVDVAFNGFSPNNFAKYFVPLVARPQEKAGLDDFVSQRDGGDITVTSYLVEVNSPSFHALNTICEEIYANPLNYGENSSCFVDGDGYIRSSTIEEAVNGLEYVGYSSILISGKLGLDKQQVTSGNIAPVIASGVELDREQNKLQIIANGYIDPSFYRIYTFILYNKVVNVMPEDGSLDNLQSNRFDLQVLTEQLDEHADPATLDFAIEFLNRLKAFHSQLNVIRTRIELSETYEVCDLSVGGEYEQRYDTDIGRLQVPPAIIPLIPEDVNDCTQLDPLSLGYKSDDLVLRERKLGDLPREYDVWKSYDQRASQSNVDGQRLSINIPDNSRASSKFNSYGQDRLLIQDRSDTTYIEYSPSPNSNQAATLNSLSPINDIVAGDFSTTGGSASSNKDSSIYGSFINEHTDTQIPLTKLDGLTDFKYKGRVEDELLHRSEIKIDDIISNRSCDLSFGKGLYYTFPVRPSLIIRGTNRPSRNSRTLKTLHSGFASDEQIHYDDSIVRDYVSYDYSKYPKNINSSLMGRLYLNYNRPVSNTLHYNDNKIDFDQIQYLAISRPNLDIQKPDCHFPGTRFARMHKLLNDYTSTYEAKPWDDQHSSVVGCNAPQYLNYQVTVGTDGNEYLSYDFAYFYVPGNNLLPDIDSFDTASLGTSYDFASTDVIHKIFVDNIADNPAVSFDEADNTDATIINSSFVMFSSGLYCGTTGIKDLKNGYPSLSGYQPYVSIDLGNGEWDDVLIGLGLEIGTTNDPSDYLFTFGSGIRNGVGHRFDCLSISVDCDGVVYESDNRLKYYDTDEGYDFSQDHVNIGVNQVNTEEIGTYNIRCDGQIVSFMELATI